MTRYYTDIKQSKQLLELGLDSRTADIYLYEGTDGNWYPEFPHEKDMEDVPSWSVGVLLDILAKKALEFDDDGSASLHSWMGKWSLNMYDCPIKCSEDYSNSIDACYEMIVKVLKNERETQTS